MKYLLDTNVWIWWHSLPEKLSPRTRTILGDPASYEELLLSAISVWEFAKLVAKGRYEIEMSVDAWVEKSLNTPKLRLAPITRRIAIRSTTLPGGFHSDPADEIIVATAREENATLLTKDRRIRRYRHARALW